MLLLLLLTVRVMMKMVVMTMTMMIKMMVMMTRTMMMMAGRMKRTMMGRRRVRRRLLRRSGVYGQFIDDEVMMSC